MNLKFVVEELRSECPSLENRVFGVAEYAQIEESMSFDLPAAFVVPISEDADEVMAQNRYLQEVKFTFAVILMTSTGSEDGFDAWENVEKLKAEVFKAILGYDQKDKSDWIEYDGLSISNLNRANLTVQLNFQYWYTIKENVTRHGEDIERLGRFKKIVASVDAAVPDGKTEAKFEVNL